MKILEYIQQESTRQSATEMETIGMVAAWKYIFGASPLLNLGTIKHACWLINGLSDFRQVPAVFNQGQPAVDPQLIPRAMMRWYQQCEEYVHNPFFVGDIDDLMKEFLAIHPFADGNGRVASLLYNHYRGTMLDPIPLPYYYGQE